jgi:hypothetical protein
MGERGQTICSGRVPSSGAKLCALLCKLCALAQNPPNPNLLQIQTCKSCALAEMAQIRPPNLLCGGGCVDCGAIVWTPNPHLQGASFII